MVKKLAWDDHQVLICQMLHDGTQPEEIATRMNCGITTVEKVAAALKRGDHPKKGWKSADIPLPPVTTPAKPEPAPAEDPPGIEDPPDAAANAAAEAAKAAAKAAKTAAKAASAAAPKASEVQTTTETTEASLFRLISKVQNLTMTPDIFISYMCALKRGYPGDLQGFLSLACRDFWSGREVNPFEEVSGGNGKGEGVAGEAAGPQGEPAAEQ